MAQFGVAPSRKQGGYLCYLVPKKWIVILKLREPRVLMPKEKEKLRMRLRDARREKENKNEPSGQSLKMPQNVF
jgi:hypothetical protein